MTKAMISLAAALLLAVGSLGQTFHSAAHAADIVIGAGAGATDHVNVSRALCRQIQRAVKGVSCDVRRTEGGDAAEPVAVLSDLRNAALELGIVRADWQYHAVKGSGPMKFFDIKFDSLRAVLSLQIEPVTLIARRDSGIGGLDDLAGKRINIGKPGSQERAAMEMVMKAKGWTRRSFQFVDELSAAEQSLALCHNRVQAIVSTAAHPNLTVARTLKLCDARIVPVEGAVIAKLVDDNPFLLTTAVAAGAYEGMDDGVATIGVPLTLLSSEDMDVDLIHTVTGAVLGELDRFRKMHPVLDGLTAEDMMKRGRAAPVHDGALRYFREKGMI